MEEEYTPERKIESKVVKTTGQFQGKSTCGDDEDKWCGKALGAGTLSHFPLHSHAGLKNMSPSPILNCTLKL